jgi:hypothetical protein
LTLFAASLLAVMGALLTLAACPSLFIGGSDCVDAGSDNGTRYLGRAANDGTGRADDRSDNTALKHQACAYDGDEGRAVPNGFDHVAFSRCRRVNRQW